jgi:hypothetical protein
MDYSQMGDGMQIDSQKVLTMGLNGTFYSNYDTKHYSPAPFKFREDSGQDF